MINLESSEIRPGQNVCTACLICYKTKNMKRISIQFLNEIIKQNERCVFLCFRKDKSSRFLTVSAFLFCSFLFLTISTSNGFATILFYIMVGQLNPVSNAQTSNNKSYYSNISSNVLTDTILSCCWMKCHKRTNKKKTDGNETENTNEDSNNNDDKRRRCKDWVLIVSSSMHQFSSFLFNSSV